MEQKITPPTKDDISRIAEQEAVVLRLLKSRYGDVILKRDEGDLQLLQRLIDDKALRPDQTYELQCMGIVLGQVLVARTGLRWITVEDEYGRDRALQYPSTTVIVFPLTMISKRVEDGREVDVVDLFNAVRVQVEKMKDDPEYKR